MSFHEWFVYQKIGLEIESAKILKFNTALEVFRVCLTVIWSYTFAVLNCCIGSIGGCVGWDFLLVRHSCERALL